MAVKYGGEFVLIFCFVVSVTQAVLPDEGTNSDNPTNWTSEMMHCFISGSSIKPYESGTGPKGNACQQLQEVDSCCRRNDFEASDPVEVRKILVDAISMAREKFCKSDKMVSSIASFASRPWQCTAELTTIFEQCLMPFSVRLKVPLEKFSFAECHTIYSTKDCTAQQILNCRSPPLLDVFNGFIRALLARTLCEQQENVNDM